MSELGKYIDDFKRELKIAAGVKVSRRNKIVVREVINIEELKAGQEIETFANDIKYKDKWVLFNRKDKELDKTVVPGIHYIAQDGGDNMVLTPTSFTSDRILDSVIKTKEVEDLADSFIEGIKLLKDLDLQDIPKRSILLYGPPGTGKSAAIKKICNKYVNDNKTAILIFQTDKYSSYDVKDFLKDLEYDEKVDKLIFIMEDLGGVETEDRHASSDPALLSILDNQEKIFKVPTLILTTTNFPETFLENIGDRPGRVDDKIKVGHPEALERITLLEFFYKRDLTDEEKKAASHKKCDKFSVAHIKECVIRSVLHKKSLVECIKSVARDSELYQKAFNDREKGLGLGGE